MSLNNSIAKSILIKAFLLKVQTLQLNMSYSIQGRDSLFPQSSDQQCWIYTPKSTEKPCIIHAYLYSISMLFINVWDVLELKIKIYKMITF